MKRVALYLRSSKDRNDVSPDAQRRALVDLANSRGETVVAEFVDSVESGKDKDRPGFQAMLRAIHNPGRGWDTVLMYDTARLSRRREISIIFEETDCRRNGVRVVYRSLPDMPALSELLLKSTMQAMDEYHSLSSRERGLAGMAENVRQGWRAGGKAPLGYRLKRVPTGASRDGAAVTKSVLEPDPQMARWVAGYLQARAAGVPLAAAQEQAGLTSVKKSTLIGLEWNALQYAGHTVWNVHAEKDESGYVGGSKRRPRKDWLIRRETHPALISDADAEALLARLQARAEARRAAQVVQRDRTSSALLGGRLVAPDGRKYWSESDRYRLKGTPSRSIARGRVDEVVLERVLDDLASGDFAIALLRGTRESLSKGTDPEIAEALKARIAIYTTRISKLMDLALAMESQAPALRRIDDLEAERAELERQLAAHEQHAEQAALLDRLSIDDVQRELAAIVELARDGDAGIGAAMMALVDRVELDPVTLDARLYYRLAPGSTAGLGLSNPESGVRVASPRVPDPNPRIVLRWSVPLRRVCPRFPTTALAG